MLMKTTERKVCSQLISIGRACTALAGTCLPLGQCMETLIRLLSQLYVCLANLTRHLILRSALVAVSLSQTKYVYITQYFIRQFDEFCFSSVSVVSVIFVWPTRRNRWFLRISCCFLFFFSLLWSFDFLLFIYFHFLLTSNMHIKNI